jgi:hypothetical protein
MACGETGLCVGASGCRSGLCTQPCEATRECGQGARCYVFESIGQKGAAISQGYCLATCAADADCQSELCDPDIQACITASLRYDLGSPVLENDASCTPVPVATANDGPFASPHLLTEPGEIYVFGPAVAMDPVDPRIRYVAYNSLAGTEISVTQDAGVTWARIPMSPPGTRYNIGDPGLAVNPDTREVWHSFLTVPQIECVVDETTELANSVAVTSSKDLGLTWSAPTPVDVGRYTRGYFIDRPAIAVLDESVFVTFVAVPAAIDDPHTEVVFANSGGGGNTWSISQVSSATRALLRRAPTIVATSGGALHISWFEKDGVEAHRGSVWVASSADGGRTFTEQRISGALLAREDGPSLSWSDRGSTVYVVFGASLAGLSAENVYLAMSVDGGLTFGPPERLSHFCGSAWSPTSAVDAAGDLWTIWYQGAKGKSQVAWLKATNPAATGRVASTLGVIGGSLSPFTMSRSPLVSLGDFVGLASSKGVTAAAWTSINDDPLGGTIYTSATDAR